VRRQPARDCADPTAHRRYGAFNENGRAIEIAVSGPSSPTTCQPVLGASSKGVGLAQVPEPIAASDR